MAPSSGKRLTTAYHPRVVHTEVQSPHIDDESAIREDYYEFGARYMYNLVITTRLTRLIKVTHRCDLTARRILERQQRLLWRDECSIFRKTTLHRIDETTGCGVIVSDEEEIVNVAE
jgi:hypothetical protein